MRKLIYAIATVILLLCTISCHHDKDNIKTSGELDYLKNTENLSAEERGKVLDSMWNVTKQRPSSPLTDQALKLIAYLYYFDNQFSKQRVIMKGMYNDARTRGDSVTMAYSLYNIATSFDGENVNDSAYFYHLRAGKIYETLKDTLNIGLSRHYNSKILLQHGNYAEAEALEISALKLFKQLDSPEDISNSYGVLGSCLTSEKKYNKALEYYNMALAEIPRMKKAGADPATISGLQRLVYGNMGVVYDKKGNYEQALAYYAKALKTSGLSRGEEAVFIGNIAYARMMMGEDEKSYMPDLYESLRVLDSFGADFHKLDPEKSIAKHYLKKGDTLRAVALLNAAYIDARDAESTEDMQEILELLITADRKNVVKNSKKYFKLNDSVHSVERATRDKFARISYETDAIERQNKTLNRKYNLTIIAAVVLLLLAIGIIVIIRLRSRNKELVYNQQQQEANEKIYSLLLQQEIEAENARMQERNRLAMELHDGIINRIFTTRFNLMQLRTDQNERKEELVNELQETQNEIRQLSHDLKESFLTENESFADVLKAQAEKQNETGSTVFDVFIDKFINWANVLPESRVALLRIVQEACTNVHKYSKAKTCHVALLSQGDKVKLRIWDDGVGFDQRKTKTGIGFRNMEDRIKSLNGALTVTSSEGNGVVIEAIL